MKNQSALVKCAHCKCSVRSDRLEKHLRKVHRLSEKAITKSAHRQSQILSASRKFKEICVLIEEFLTERDIVLESLEYIEDFSLMAFEILLGYTTDEVITIGGIQNRNTYISNSNRLQHIFLPLIEPLCTLLEPYKKAQSPASSILLNSDSQKRRSISEPLNDSHTENKHKAERSPRSAKRQRLSRWNKKYHSLFLSRSSSKRIGSGYFPHIGQSSSSTSNKLDKKNISSGHFSHGSSSSSSAPGRCRFCGRLPMYGADVCHTCNTD